MEEHKTLMVLDDRIRKLKSIIVAKIPLDDVKNSKVKSVLSALHEVDTVLISTLSGREKIGALMKKVDLLEEICDPSYMQTHFNLDSKLEAILAGESDLVLLSQELQRIEELDSVLDKDNVEKLTSVSDRLNKLTSNVLVLKEECDEQAAEVKQLAIDYKQSMADLTQLFAEIETLVLKLEHESGK